MKIKHIFLVAVGLIVLNLCVMGQAKVVTKTEYDEIVKLRENIRDQSRIVTRTRKRYSGGKIWNGEKDVIKYESTKRSHWVKSKLVDGKFKITEQIIYYDDKEFRKKEDDKWLEINRKTGGFGAGDAIKVEKLEQYVISNIYMNGEPTRMFSHHRILKIDNRLIFNNNNEFVDQKGNILASKYIISEIFQENITYVFEAKYEYNPKNLKIKKPKL